MYYNILLPIALDHGADVERVVKVAESLGGPSAKIRVLTVLETAPVYVSASLPDDYEKTAEKRVLSELKAALGTRDDIEIVVKHGHASAVILEFAARTNVDCIVIEARSKPFPEEFLLGSIAQRIARRAQCSVHVCR